MATASQLAREASILAQTRLRPAAADVDAAEELPQGHFTALRRAGLFGVLAADQPLPLVFDVGETLTSACLTTGFIWAQHQGAILRIMRGAEPMRDRWLPSLLSGQTLGGITYGGLPTHGATLRATATDDGGLILDGQARFITSWPWIGLLVAWAYEAESGLVHSVVVPEPRRLGGTTVTPLRLVAANASGTVAVKINSWAVPASDIITSIPVDRARTIPTSAARSNATLALGLLSGIAQDLGECAPDEAAAAKAHHARLRSALDRLAVESSDDVSDRMTATRAELLTCTMDAAVTLHRTVGSAAALTSNLAPRRLREAAFIQSVATTAAERHAAEQVPRHATSRSK